MTGRHSSSRTLRAPTSSLLLSSPSLMGPEWSQVHAQLVQQPTPADSPLRVGGLTLYHYCVAKASGHAQDAALAHLWLERLVAQLWPLPALFYSPVQLDQASLVAWLNTEGQAVPAALLAALDTALYQQALRLLISPNGAGRRAFFQILRYFSLRLSAAHSHLLALVDAWPATPLHQAQKLGLVEGYAAELLLYVRLAQAGIATDRLTNFVRFGLRQLLATKRDVDFSRQHYAIFPDELARNGQPVFSAELNWCGGDMGQAILLYEAYNLLQDPELVRLADLVGLHTLLRTTPLTTEVTDISLYRGSAGVAQCYRRLYLLSHHPAYLRGYEFWLGQTCSWLPAVLPVDSASDVLRNGLAGTGLVLLSARTGQELGWEHPLFGATCSVSS